MQRILLTAYNNVAQVADILHQHIGLHRIVDTVEIGRYAPFETFRLSDIYHRPVLVVVKIAPRGIGKHADFFFQSIIFAHCKTIIN